MKEAHLRDFTAVVAHGGIRAAARQLGLTQAAVSRNLLALEKECGAPLLLRSSRGVELTDFGRILLRGARAAASELKRAREDMEALSGERRGWVSIGVPPAIEALYLSTAIDRFRARFPHVLVRVTGGPAQSTLPGLREGRLDFILGSAEAGGDDGLTKERWMVTELAVVARKGHPLAGASSMADLVDAEWVVGIPAGMPQAEIEPIFAAAGLPRPRIGVQRDSLNVVHLLATSDRVALVAKDSVDLYCTAGIVQILPITEEIPAVPLYLITVSGRDLTIPAKSLASEFKELIRARQR